MGFGVPLALSGSRKHNETMHRILITGGAGFIGSNLALAIQDRFPNASLVLLDDFRSGHFSNLEGYRGDLCVERLGKVDFKGLLGDQRMDVVFHLASITDTTEHDQFLQLNHNVEDFRHLLKWACEDQTPVVYASSAATYGQTDDIMTESKVPSPQNVYAFSKVQMDNLASQYARQFPAWKLVGLKFFNVYGPREAHKGAASSMIYQLYRQMRNGQRPRIFHDGEQRRDFIHVEDVVEACLGAAALASSGVYNIGSGVASSFHQVIGALNKAMGLQYVPEYIPNPYAFYQAFTQAEIIQARNAFQYQPRMTLQDGVKQYVDWLDSAS
jgi:ADP-L-glycero-D-manno-heptose 6-epimerase